MRLRRHAFFASGLPSVDLLISTAVSSYSARAQALAAGWDGVMPVVINIRVSPTGAVTGGNPGVAIEGFPVGSRANLVVDAGGQIWGSQGYGGSAGAATAISAQNGGGGSPGYAAIRTTTPISITNDGIIAGGGGGGGGGGGAFRSGSPGNYDAFASGGAGGDGQGYNSAASPGGPSYTSNPPGGAVAVSGAGGWGGAAGEPGGSGGSGNSYGGGSGAGSGVGGSGGAPGAAIVGASLVTLIKRGDMRGGLTG